MPIYDYKCRNCGIVSERLVSYSAATTDYVCPNCGGNNLEKQMSVPLLHKRCNPGGLTCCGAEERCDSSPCSGGRCHN